MSSLAAFRALVHADPELALRLRRTPAERFVDEVVRIAAERGCSLETLDVQLAIDQGRREWLQRWLR